MPARPFIRLQDVVLAPPLPAVLALLMGIGLFFLGWRLAARLRGGTPEKIDVAAGFIVATATLAAILQALALAQLSTVSVLRPMGWALAAVGGTAIARQARAAGGAARAQLASLATAPWWEKSIAVVAAVVTLGLGAAALGPVTDADSIGYHLAVPLDWLRHGGAYPRPDWFHARLIGVAEGLNMLGLAAGTDAFGAVLQLGGLVAAAIALGTFATNPRDRRIAWLLAVSAPVTAFLVPNQKPQMLPSAATTVALVLAVRRWDDFSVNDALLAFVCATFAFAAKTSFLLTSGFTIIVGLLAARRSGHLGRAFGIVVAAAAAIWAPVLWRNFTFYGDPISPFLERFSAHPDPAIIDFATYLRNASGERTLANLLRLPLDILGTTNPGALTLPLGLGALAFLPSLRATGRTKILLAAALVAALTCLVLGQIAPRFFLEPFFWAGAALAAAPWTRLKKAVVGGIFLQGCLTAAIAVFGAASLFPGAWTAARRETVMTRAAAGYAESQWLDHALPADAVMIEPNGRFQLFTPRPFAVADPAYPKFPDDDLDERLARLVSDFGIDTMVIDGGPSEGPFLRMARRCGTPMGAPQRLPVATRNPLNRAEYSAQAFALRGCGATLRGPRP